MERADLDSAVHDGIGTQLRKLEASALIRLADTQPELEYIFRHALIHDAAYQSLVKGDRRAQHRIVGDVLERLHADRLDELAPVLAFHFFEAGDGVRALKYYTQAGDVALRRYANAEAIVHYTHALELATGMGGGAMPFLHLYSQRGRALELSGQYEQALANYRAMESSACERDDRALQLSALMARATIHSTPSAGHDPQRAKSLSEQALSIARELGDRRAECKILWNLMLLGQFTGQMHEAVVYGEQSLAIARELDLREQLAYTLNDIVRAYVGVGQFARARTMLDEARDIWRTLGNIPMLTDNLGRSARIYCAVGEYERALAAADEARTFSESISNLWGQAFSRMFVGLIHYERGDMATAVATMTTCVQLAAQAGLVMALVGTRADLAWTYGKLGATTQGLALARAAQETADQQLPVFRPWALGSLARLQIMHGDLAAAEVSVAEGYDSVRIEDLSTHGAVHIPMADAELAFARQDYGQTIRVMDLLIGRLRKVGMQPFLSEALYLKGRGLLAREETDEAAAVLREAGAQAESLNARQTLWPVLASLSALEERRGNRGDAQRLRSRARELITYIVGHIPTEELRDLFQRLPSVRDVMA